VITNRSSGKMGYALAEAARDRGARVTLVSTEPSLPLPYGVELAPVETVAQMRDAVLAACDGADALIMAAAVSDYRPAEAAAQKLKKGEGGMMLPLVRNDSFFPEVPASVVKVAFAAETEDLIENAMRKPQTHGPLDLIVANDVSASDAGFGVDTNRVVILDAAGGKQELPLLTKYEVAQRVLDRLLPILRERNV
jgi:phosphopantothenoylcysteine decarboxylase/phosphopantothenate--cysteine ligase